MYRVRKFMIATTLVGAIVLNTVLPVAAKETVATSIATLGITENEFHIEHQKPHIVVDTRGYIPNGKKVIYIQGSQLEKSFQIIDVENNEVVYENSLVVLKESENGNNLYMGDFSSFSVEGKYRIFQQDVGYSYEFVIDEATYKKLYREKYQNLVHFEGATDLEMMYALSMLMTTNEFYETAYNNRGYIKKSIRSLLVDEKIEKINESLSTTACYAGVMAQFYAQYFDKEPELARECIQAANKAFAYVDQYRDNVASDAYYFAASQLYRATGNYKCRNSIAYYDSIPKESRICSEVDMCVLADISYLKSSYKTDYKRCEMLMNDCMDEMVALSNKTGRQSYYVQDDIDINDIDVILDNMIKLSIISYVVSGREYASIRDNYIHYLSGVNPQCINFLVGDDSVVDGNIVSLSKLLFAMGGNCQENVAEEE